MAAQNVNSGSTASRILPPRLIDIDPELLSTIELEIMLNVPITIFPRPYLMQLANLAAHYFITSGRYPGFGACFDLMYGDDGRAMGANYRFEGCVCGSCPGHARNNGQGRSWDNFEHFTRLAFKSPTINESLDQSQAVAGRAACCMESHTSDLYHDSTSWYLNHQKYAMKLRHIHLPGLTHYKHGDKLQDLIVRHQLAAKADPSLPKPPPTIITAQFRPVYTTGRRDYGLLTEDTKRVLRDDGRADVFEALRGGQTTYHGPGQLTAYPIIDLRQHKLGTRDYICVLEKSLIALCAKYGVKAMTTENTGVWVTEDKKIAAVGVHLRRYVSSHGIGLNVDRRVDWGFGRIVACGLEGKLTTSLEAEGATGLQVDEVGKDFAEELAKRLTGVEGVEVGGDPLSPDSS